MSVILSNSSPLLELSRGHESAVLTCKFLNSGATAVSSGLDAHLCVWDLTNSRNFVIDHLFRQNPAITSLGTLGGPLVAAGASSSQIALVDIETGQKLRSYSGHTKAVNQIHTISNDTFVSVSDDGSAKLWDLHQKKPVWEASTPYPLFTATIASAHQDNYTLYISGLEPTIRAYDIRQTSGQELFSWTSDHADSITSIDVNSTHKMCSLAFDNEIHIQDAKQRPMRDSRFLGIIDASSNDNTNKFLVRNRFTNQERHVISGGSLFDVTTKEHLVDFLSVLKTRAAVIDTDYDQESNKVLMSSENGNLYVYQL
ncbi:LAME_0B05842g1_1 [Lachancea meyersii CBS 8951]|uniref:LAME_0B05842g1_1 n=1 Tax=Lachancea meyersii CBS 8951 TaxID=1266667 RepID=A0A1G4IWF8_9SACH|nr:LAME_0B05842g1_1 [Lachancea meyersii CBS 8951]